MATEDNPYAPPTASDRALGIRSGRHEELKTVAAAQKSIIVCILLYFCLLAATPFVPALYQFYVFMSILALGLVSTVSVFVMAMKVYTIGQGLLVGILTMVPCLGLILLFLVNRKATKILRENGHDVGFFGADLSKF